MIILPEMSPAEKNVEKKVFKKRYELISDVVDKSILSIKKLNLYKIGEEIDCSWLCHFTITLLTHCRIVQVLYALKKVSN